MVEQACDKYFYSKREEKGSDTSQVNIKPNKENCIKHYASRIALLVWLSAFQTHWDSNVTLKVTFHAVAVAPATPQLSKVAPLISGLHWIQPTPGLCQASPTKALGRGMLAHLNHRGSLTHL